MKSSTPASEAIAAAVTGLSPVIITVLIPMRRSAAKRSLTSGFTTSLRWMTPSSSPAIGEAERRAAGARDAVDRGAERRAARQRRGRPARRRISRTESMAPLRSLRRPQISTPDSRVVAENAMNVASAGAACGRDAIFLLHQRDDRAAFRGLVGIAGEQRSFGGLLLGNARHRDHFGREPVAEGDGAGLVEQQRVDVAGRLHRAAGHRQHVEAHQPIHAGNADRRQQRADRGRDQRDEQRHQHDHRDRAAGIGREARDGGGGEHEDDGQPDQQDVERDFVRRLLPFGAFDQRDHAVQKRIARRRGDADDDAVRNDRGAAGHRRAVAAGFRGSPARIRRSRRPRSPRRCPRSLRRRRE